MSVRSLASMIDELTRGKAVYWIHAKRVMKRAREAGCVFEDSDSPAKAIESVCAQLGIPTKDADLLADKIVEINLELIRREAIKEPQVTTHWIDVPAHRILCVNSDEFLSGYDRIGANGGIAEIGEEPAFILRKRDGRRFKKSRFLPVDEMEQHAKDLAAHTYTYQQLKSPIYLEEM